MTRESTWNGWNWSLLIGANVLAWCVLGLFQASTAAPNGPMAGGQPPFANPIDQRNELLKEIRETNTLLREQISLLKSGKLQVVVEAKK